jgi:hypothetical protein
MNGGIGGAEKSIGASSAAAKACPLLSITAGDRLSRCEAVCRDLIRLLYFPAALISAQTGRAPLSPGIMTIQ